MKKTLSVFILYLLSLTLALKTSAYDPTEKQWPLSAIGWTDRGDGYGVRIAVIDTGISVKYLNSTQIREGKNYVFPDSNTDDLIGHGTAIAGIILGSESFGLKGMAPEAELVPLVYYSQYPSGVPQNGGVEAITKAIYDAVDVYGCRIINLSSGITAENEELKKAIDYAEEKNAVVISPVGNDKLSSPDNVYYPAAYETVIGVGAETLEGLNASFSQCNSSVKLLAPGDEIPALPTGNSGKLRNVSGDSYSAAFISGAVARMIESNPSLKPSQIRKILYETATDAAAEGYDIDTGWGLLNLSASVEAAENYLPFTDVDSTKSYYKDVLLGYRKGIIRGTDSDGCQFSPDDKTTKAMLATLLYRVDGEHPSRGLFEFEDVKPEMWYTNAAQWASESNIIASSNGLFGVNDKVTLEEMVTRLWRYAEIKGYETIITEDMDLSRYIFNTEISEYAYNAFRWVCSNGIISETDAFKDPRAEVSRAQAAVIIMRFYELYSTKE